WMHNGLVRINEEKMSKSLDNFFTIRDVLKAYDPESVRYFLLGTHYRAPINYSEENLRQADAAVRGLYIALRDVDADPGPLSGDALVRFRNAMSDDFNTPEAFAVLKSLATDLNTAKGAGRAAEGSKRAGPVKGIGEILGLLQDDPTRKLQRDLRIEIAQPGQITIEGQPVKLMLLSREEIEAHIARRNEARASKDWKESDRIRDVLAAAGIVLEDGPKGTTWRRKKTSPQARPQIDPASFR